MTAASAFESTDLMHYESRAIKEGLKASIKRLQASKGYIPPSLTPAQLQQHGPGGAAAVQQDWSAPKVVVDCDQSNPLGAGDPKFEDMRACLLQFESGPYQAASSKEKAFYSALRTLLGDITVTKDANARAMQITAAHKWYWKHRPRGYSEDPAVFAAMAASLSLQGVQQPARTTGSEHKGLQLPFMPQGTKHEFFAIYSKDSHDGAPGPGLGPCGSQPASRGQTHDAVSAAAAARAARLPSAPGTSASGLPPRAVMPVVMQPAVPRSLSPSQREQLQREEPQPHRAALQAQQEVAVAAAVLVPKSKARVVLEPTLGAGAGTAPGASQGQQTPPWNSGPYRDAGFGRGPRQSAQAKAEEASELEALRRKWSTMDAQTNHAVVEVQVQQWSQQRARLEEEIIRRQEASRYASPSMHASAHAMLGPGGGGQASGAAHADGYMSPYAGLVSDQMGMDSEAGALASAAQQVPGLVLPASVTATARDVRAKAQEQHAREVIKISRRMAQLGLQRRAQPEVIEHALSPVPDKAYLECLAKLPRPGDLLPSSSKPSSARASTAKKSGKKRGTSARKA